MVINNNVLSTQVLNYYNQNSTEMNTAMRHLSTGSRIPSVVEGISDYAIAKKLQIQIGILQQGINNAQINRAMLETAFEGIDNQREMLSQIRDIALKAMDDTYSNTDRAMMQKEIDELLGGISQIASQTGINGGNAVVISNPSKETAGYGGKSLLDSNLETGGLSAAVTGRDVLEMNGFQEGMDNGRTDAAEEGNAPPNEEFHQKSDPEIYISTPTDSFYQNMQTRTGPKKSAEDVKNAQKGLNVFCNKTLDHLAFDDAELLKAMDSSAQKDEDSKTGAARRQEDKAASEHKSVIEGNFNTAAIEKPALADKNEAQEGSIFIGGTSLSDLFPPDENGRQTLSVRTKEDAAKFLDAVNQADEYLLHTQAKISAAAQMMGYDIDNLTTQYEALTEAYSTIADADMARETVLFVKHKLSSQAALGMLKQSAHLPENALYLLS